MMIKVHIEYEGQLHCSSTHEPSGNIIQTDAPVDNHGRGESFSPTDLVAAALGSCIATVMGIYADKHDDISLEGMCIDVEKHMQVDPRRIGRLPVTVTLPTGVLDKHIKALERVANLCPVHASLHPDIDSPIVFLG